MDLSYLKQATRAEHEATESTVPLMAPELTREQYVATLQRMYRAVAAWDDWSLQHVPARLQPLLEGRQRSVLLATDIVYFGAKVPEDLGMPALPQADVSEAEFLGRMYVMEGSSLGGQYIARHVEDVLGLQPGNGDAYFRGYGEQTSAKWKAFQAVLSALSDREADAVVSAAKEMFAFFATCMSPNWPANA